MVKGDPEERAILSFQSPSLSLYLHFKKESWNNEAWVLRAESESERRRKGERAHKSAEESEEKAGADK